ncbi:MAG: Maf family protein [Gammaproteobacteria bacterium]|nr:Maf family protein [Gammaproteobacteria bacterium]
MKTHIVLASASARRRDLMRQAGFDFRISPANIDESPHPGETPSDLVLRLALGKARAVAGEAACSAQDDRRVVVVGADTVVVSSSGDVFGKPTGRDDFLTMFRALAGGCHRVLTGVAVVAGERSRTALAEAHVTLRDVPEAEMSAYWATGEPRDKAGGYGLQGLGAIFVRAIEGSPSAVVGLPLDELERLLTELGVETWRFRGARRQRRRNGAGSKLES